MTDPQATCGCHCHRPEDHPRHKENLCPCHADPTAKAREIDYQKEAIALESRLLETEKKSIDIIRSLETKMAELVGVGKDLIDGSKHDGCVGSPDPCTSFCCAQHMANMHRFEEVLNRYIYGDYPRT
jgi:hypothetical protein